MQPFRSLVSGIRISLADEIVGQRERCGTSFCTLYSISRWNLGPPRQARPDVYLPGTGGDYYV
eukprot:scaffold20309_cov18-Prasinocladus_malaysianus.AAC.1